MGNNSQLFFEFINLKRAIEVVNGAWAKSLPAVIMLCVGLWIGSTNTETRIVSDCKFAGTFRVDIQAFSCQRKI